MASIINAGQTALTVTPDTTGALTIQANGTSAIAIDNTQRVGLGTTTPNTRLHVTGAGSGIFGVYDDVAKFKGTSYTYIHLDGTNNQSGMVISANTDKGWFVGHDNSQGLKFTRMTSLNQDGISNAKDSGTPSMLLTSGGAVFISKTTAGIANAGFEYDQPGGALLLTRSNANPMAINRLGNDGILIDFYQDSNQEGTISVSGSTVSYNGGHLSRWSQLPDGSKDDTILKGTILSNLDDMCVWVKDGETLPNEQLNKMKVSDVEGDTNVAGVFVNWTRDEDCNTDDMNVAMTGDMIIRIAEGVTVARGDLLMSAGDGTAKPQGDDIVRSKTIAKVTSTHITYTYEDGSYCVPCVLMAC